ncbi:MAG TPA: DUF3626 domain-containing protein [Cytophagales bacterium]
MHLTHAQEAAIRYVEKYASTRRERAKEAIEEVRAMSNIPPAQLAQALRAIKTHARVVLHFHPDRLDNQGLTVAESMLTCGSYRNQFETGVSNGKLSPLPGGPRDTWENQLFGGRYGATGIAPGERPKYGALDLMRHPDGPAPRFGSCYLVLKPEVSARCTFSYLDSHRSPAERGTLAVFEDILAALLTECFERNYALGEHHLSPAALTVRLESTLPLPYADPARGTPARVAGSGRCVAAVYVSQGAACRPNKQRPGIILIRVGYCVFAQRGLPYRTSTCQSILSSCRQCS